MNKNLCRFFFGLFLVFALSACSGHTVPVDKLAEMSRDDFMSAMRWKQYKVATAFMQQEEDKEYFLRTFRALKGLHITDVRLLDVKSYEQGRRFQTTMEIDYYLPPSVTLETFSFDQTWVYFEEQDVSLSHFQIVTPFPDFP